MRTSKIGETEPNRRGERFLFPFGKEVAVARDHLSEDPQAVKEPPDDRKDGKTVHTAPESLADLKEASHDLKERIIEEKKRNAMPINSSLGDPEVDARNADGHNDLPDDDDE